MTCSQCQHENPADAKFCNSCGVKLNAVCSQCGRVNPAGSRFCNECGSPLTAQTKVGQGTSESGNRRTGERPVVSSQHSVVSSSSIPSSRSPISYTPVHLAERIRAEQAALEARGNPEGERKTITALFVDIKDSTNIIAELDPEEAQAIIDPTLQLMMDAVHRYEGYVAQPLGDGIFALFGAPIAHEDHPQRALYAALLMQEENRKRAEQLRREQGINLQLRVGINTGEVVLRSIRKEDLQTDYVPVGQSTNLASRMEHLATPGSILVSEQTYKLTEGYFEFKPLGQAQVKGFPEPLNIYEVSGVGPLRTKLQLSVRRGLAKFVGRQQEMAILQNAWEHTQNGHGQIAAVMGEPGVGKSRLFYEFKLLIQKSCLVLETFSVSHGKAYPYLPLIDLLKNYFQLTAHDDDRRRREKITGKVLTLDRGLEDILPYLFFLLGIAEPNSPLQQMDGQIRRQRILDAIKRLLLRESLNQPLLIIFEDLHWLDNETQAFLQLLSESLATARILLLVNYRPEYQAPWHGKTYFSQLRLDPLGKEQAEEMLTALLGEAVGAIHESPLYDLKRFILDKTEGNPFFMEEIVRELLEQGVLTRDPVGAGLVPAHGAGSQLRTGSGTPLQLPTTVQGVLTARMDRLPAEEKALLQTLAVIGREFAANLLRKVVTHSESDLQRLLARLQAAEFVYGQPAYPEVEYIFKHALTQEVAYNSLLIERRKILHERTAQAMEEIYKDRLDDHYSELAYHYSRSGNTQKAIDYLQLAGQQAVQRSAYVDAISHLTTALEFFKILPETLERDQQELRLLISLGPAFYATKSPGALEVEQVYTRARKLCQQVGDTAQLFFVLRGLYAFHIVRGAFRTAHILGEQLLRLAQSAQGSAFLPEAYFVFGQTLFHFQGDLTAAHSHYEEGIVCYDPRQHHAQAFLYGQDSGVFCRAQGAWVLWLLGYPEQARQRSHEALTLARELNHPQSLAFALMFAAYLHVFRREEQTVYELTEELRRLCSEEGFPHMLAYGMAAQGWAIAKDGEKEKGSAQIRDELAALRDLGAEINRPLLLAWLAETHQREGRGEEGLSTLAEAMDVASQSEEQCFNAELCRLCGELVLVQSSIHHNQTLNVKEAEEYFLKAIDVARKQSAKSLELRAAMSLARLWQSQGKKTEAHDLLAPVYNWFTEGFDTKDLQEAKSLLEELRHIGADS